MNWLCKMFGHRWVFDRNERAFSDNAGSENWWFKYSKCPRCLAEKRELFESRSW